MMSAPPLTALVMAASRRGVDDAVARIQNKSHKCLVEIDGVAMIERVVQALLESGCFKRILVSIEDQKVLENLAVTRRWLAKGVIEVVPSSGTLTDSVIRVGETVEEPVPLVITTADNALHTPELVRYFVSRFIAGTADVAVAVARQSTVMAEFPDGKFGFFQFRDGGYSFCNLFGIRSPHAFEGAKIFRTGGQFRKHPWRMLRIFGVLPLILYKWRLLALDRFVSRIAHKLGFTVDTVILPFAFGPIDVDNPTTFEFSERTLRARRQQSG